MVAELARWAALALACESGGLPSDTAFVEWLDRNGAVLASSDFAARARYLAFVARYRTPCLAHFHKAARVSMSDELAVAMNKLIVGQTESVKQSRRLADLPDVLSDSRPRWGSWWRAMRHVWESTR